MTETPYLIALDMDGTLLNNKKKISLLTKLHLRKLSRKGHKIILSSGRPYRSLDTYYNQLRLNTPVICYNGAYCFSPKDTMFEEIKFAFPKDEVFRLINELKPYVHNFMCESNKDIWIDNKDEYLARFFWYGKMNIHEGDITKTLKEDPMTFIAQQYKGKENPEKIKEIISSSSKIGVRFWTNSPHFEMYFLGTSKGARILDIAKYYNIPKERIIVFGDAGNDVEMLSITNNGVAMKNARYDLSKVAKYTSVKDNNHNGIYYTLKKYFKL